MKRSIRLFMGVEALVFSFAVLVHAGVLVAGYVHSAARIAETVIAGVLVAGLALSAIRPTWTRPAGLLAQGFALLGTLVGVLTIVVGVGPRSVPDVIYHAAIVALLIAGLTCAVRAPASRS